MYPSLSKDCSYCNEFREWNDADVALIEAHRMRGEVWTAHIGNVVLPRCREFLEHCRRYHPDKKKDRKRFAFTFTTNSNEGVKEQVSMCEAAWRLMLQQTNPVVEGEVFLEYTEAERPHLHGWYETQDGGRIFAKVFRRCWHRWSEKDRQKRFAGGYHEEMKTKRYQDYASAEGRVILQKKLDEDVVYHAQTAETWWPSA